MNPLQWCLKDHWSPMVDDLAVQMPLSQECVEAVRWWLQERWVFSAPLQVPPPSLLLLLKLDFPLFYSISSFLPFIILLV